MTEPDERLRRELDRLVPVPSDAHASWEDALRRAVRRRGGDDRVSRSRQRRPFKALAVAAGIALLAGTALGFGFGSSVTPSGNAAGTPVGLGFLPAQGWDVLQTGARATKERPTVAVASNGTFAPDDAARGARNSSGLPYSTLLDLPADGIVIVARFWVRDTRPGTNLYPLAKGLPLSLRDAAPMTAYSVQVRPERPLGQYQLLAEVNDHNVELQVYFGTPRPSPDVVADAQRQVDRLVVNETKPSASLRSRALPLQPSSVRATVPKRVLDTTVVCGTSEYGGVDVIGHRGTGRAGGVWDRPAVVSVTNGSAASGGVDNPSLLDNTLTWATAGRPHASATLVEYHLLRQLYLIRTWGTHAVNNPICKPTKARAALSPVGLQGGPLGPFDEHMVCAVRPRVVVRVRVVLARAAVLQSYRKFARTTVPVKEARVVVQTQSGKRLAYGEVFESGKARLFTAPSCFVR
jgi:hypothetical protein